MLYLVFFILLAQGVLWFRAAGSWLYPPALFAICWAVFVASSTIIQFGDYSITADALMVFLIGATLFSVGGTAAVMCIGRCRTKEPVLPQRKRFIQNCIAAYSIGLLLLVPIFFIILRRVGVSLGIEEFAVAARVAFSESDRGGVPRYFVSMTSIGTVLAFCSAWLYDGERRDKINLSLAVIAPLIMNVLTFGRTPIYMLITGVVAIMVFRNTIQKRTILISVIVGIFFFVLTGVTLGKGPDFGPGKSSSFAIAEHLAVYFVGGPVGFGHVMEFPASVGESGLSLRFFTQAMSSLGWDILLPDIVTGYFSDVLGNVYTIYFAYWLDWGWSGVVVMTFLAGFLCTTIYILARKGYPIAGVGMGIVTGAILNSATVDLIFLSLIPWLLLILIVFFLWNIPILTFRMKISR